MNETTRSAGQLLSRLFHICFLPIWLVLVALSAVYHNQAAVYGLGALLCIAAVVLIFRRIRPGLDRMGDTAWGVTVAGITLLFFVLLAVVGWYTTFTPFSDAGTVYYSAAEILDSGKICDEINEYTASIDYLEASNAQYFLTWQNVFPLVPYLLPWMAGAKLLGADLYAFSGYYAATLFNCLHIAAAALIGSLLVKRMKGKAAGLLMLLLCVFAVPFYMQTGRVYSNTLPLPWIMLSVSFLLPKGKNDNPLRMIPAGLFLGIAALIKGNLYVLLVAAVIWLLLRQDKKKLLRILCLVLAVALVLGCWTLFLNNQRWIDRSDEENYRFPLSHWLMLGASEKGSYTREDSDSTASFPGIADKKEYDWDIFVQRLTEPGLSATLRRIFDKLAHALKDSTYCEAYLHRWEDTPLGPLFEDAPLPKALLPRYAFLLIMMVYLLNAVSILLRCFRPRPDECVLLNITLFGMILFFAFWELRSLYLLTVLPFLLLNSVFTLCDLAERLPVKAKGKD